MSALPRHSTPDVDLRQLAGDHAEWRRQVIFQCCKWDPQVGDTDTVADHACILSRETAAYLSDLAERLTAESLALEDALERRPDLYAGLGLDRRLRGALAATPPADAKAVRVMRFDFHPAEGGWALSEVNSDVPGGFAEASMLPVLAAQRVSGAYPQGDVATAFAAALRGKLSPGARIALVHATAYSDDRQVMQFLAGRFGQAGFQCLFLAPDHLQWSDGHAVSIAEGQAGPVDAVVRFFPAEWLPALPQASGWRRYFDARVLMCNPPRAVLSQSKRLPLVWSEIGVDMPAWSSVLPETRDPREAPWRSDDGWVLKPAMGRVGEGVAWRGALPAREWRRIARSATAFPGHWTAQRRFQSRPLESARGPRHLCIGVFTIDGRASGFYGRLSARTIIEKHAQDIPVLVAP